MKNLVLILNCGSSSLKFALMNPTTGETALSGNAERLGQPIGTLSAKLAGEKIAQNIEPATHSRALELIVDTLETHGLMAQIAAVGHRVVHGGEHFSESVIIDERVRDKVDECSRLAPLHNPPQIIGIDAAKQVFPELPQVAVFDTAFHQKMPEKAYLYALPYRFYQDFHIRKYGFHGTSFRYIASQLPELSGLNAPKAVVCHLGNGSSLAAIDNGVSLDTTLGLTPLGGLVHGTRTGDIDPAMSQVLTEQFGIPAAEVGDIMWKQSGLLGLSELSNDCRELEAAKDEGHAGAIRALSVYCYRLAKHIGSQMVAINGCDMLVFTGGIGENSAFIREQTIAQLAFLGFSINTAKNADTFGGKQGDIATTDSKPIWVIPTNEELMIARDTAQLSGMTA